MRVSTLRLRRRRALTDAAGPAGSAGAQNLTTRLSRGRAVEIEERDGRIEIEPVATSMSLVKRRGGRVAVPDEGLPALTDKIVRATLESTRR